MADASLDDFFAKKDKSKKKAKSSKLSSSDILSTQVEKPKKNTKKKDKEKSTQSSDSTVRKDDDEWKDFQEEEEKDLSGLKIQNMQIQAKEDEDADRPGDSCESGDDDGEGREKRDTTSGPWNNTASTYEEKKKAAVVAPEPKPEPPKEEPLKTTGKYIPPGVRRALGSGGGLSGSGSSTGSGYGRKKKVAPDVSSEAEFPTLGGGPAQSHVGHDGDRTSQSIKGFEQVRGGGRQADDNRLQSSELQIGNKFDALSSEDR